MIQLSSVGPPCITTMFQFNLKGEYIELYQLLKVYNFAESGGASKMLIAEGLVKVDGNTETRKACKIRKGQQVEFEGNIIQIL